jgi:hypothetical protein
MDLVIGTRVQAKYAPQHRGTVTDVEQGHRFTITYDGHGRLKGEPRARVNFAWIAADLFVPPGTEEIREVEDTRLDIPEALARKYGIWSAD